MINIDTGCSVGEAASCLGQASVIVSAGTMGVIGQPLLLLLLFSQFFCDFDVVIENCRNNRDHVSLDDSGPHALGSPDTNVDDTLEG